MRKTSRESLLESDSNAAINTAGYTKIKKAPHLWDGVQSVPGKLNLRYQRMDLRTVFLK